MSKPTAKKELTPKQKRYVDCYDGDIRKAADTAGIGYAYARQLMTLKKHAHVVTAIKLRERTQSNSRIWTRQQRQEFWTRVTAGLETQEAIVGTDKDGNAIVKEIPPAMKDRIKASELLGRSEADFTDNHSHVVLHEMALDELED